MSVLTLTAILTGLYIFGWAVWYVIELVRCVTSVMFEIDRRPCEISQ